MDDFTGYNCKTVQDDYSNVNLSDCYQVFVHTRASGESPPTSIDGYNATCTLPLSDNRLQEILHLAYNDDVLGMC